MTNRTTGAPAPTNTPARTTSSIRALFTCAKAEIVPALDTWFGTAFAQAHLSETIDALAAAQDHHVPPEVAGLREEIADCDRKFA